MGRSNLVGNIITSISDTSVFNGNKTETGSAYTLVEGDNGYIIYLSNTSTITLTIDTGLSAGFNCTVVKQSTGSIQVVAGGGVTIESNVTKAVIQYEGLTIYHKGSDTFNIFG